MGRKSKQAGSGHLPLTHHERAEYSKPYGTVTARLNSSSQYTFGHCALSLAPAKDQPVATPSGFVYERPAILEYLLVKTKEVKQQQQLYEQQQSKLKQLKQQQCEEKQLAIVQEFQESQTSVVGKKKPSSSTTKDGDMSNRKRKQSEKSGEEGADGDDNPLKRTSYWLFQPELKKDFIAEEEGKLPPPDRPSSPNSQQPLRRKDLVPLDLQRNSDDQVLCAISEKAIVTQSALALVPKASKSSNDSQAQPPAQVVLEQVYNDVVLGKSSDNKSNESSGNKKGKERSICPVTGRKIAKIIKLQRGGSSFASNSGSVEAKTYRPTMT